MEFRFKSFVSPRYLWSKSQSRRLCLVSVLYFGILGNHSLILAQAPSSSVVSPDQKTIQVLLERIEKLEARVAQLEASENPPAPAAPGPAPAEQPVSTPASETPMSERMDVSETLLRIRGFGDVNFHGDTQKGSPSSFTLGQLNLFVTSDISEKFKFLGEIVFEGGPDNIFGITRGSRNSFGVDIERFLLQYSHNDYFNLSVGRYHTAIGYYNTAYHHSTWFQTTEGRPFLFEFEDRGGILPIHNVGVSASGLVPSGPLGLHYVAEVGNGRSSRSPLDEEQVQNIVDENNHKAFNLALFARPKAISGLQAGFSVYHDLLTPLGSPNVTETILAAHAVFTRPRFEWLNEALVIRHAPAGISHVFQTPGFYTQVSRRFGAYRPYFRYEYVNASNHEPIFPDIGLRQGPSVGVRYDASESVAVKFQYDYTGLRRQPAINSLGLQVGFTF
ncbi:MAG: hypothetical protein DMG61_14775 [Acidobacteria bacterium]|nr:MAG: hypothetical protein DMG61_14775 [Acidobacteriota bacterium]PYY16529.1 MAG: hypothetical protein DMG60_14725 [Acidobacteriota bacterium]